MKASDFFKFPESIGDTRVTHLFVRNTPKNIEALIELGYTKRWYSKTNRWAGIQREGTHINSYGVEDGKVAELDFFYDITDQVMALWKPKSLTELTYKIMGEV